MTDLLQMVSRLEESGGALVLDGDRIRYSVPSGDPEARALLAELRKQRERVKGLLRQRAAEDAERRFGQAHAKLFSFIGRKVRTAAGIGTLIQVFADRCTVLLDSEVSKCARFAPAEIGPVNWEWGFRRNP